MQGTQLSGDDLAAWLRLTLVPGVGNETQRQLLNAFGLPEAIFRAGFSALCGVVGSALAERLASHDCGAEIEAALAWAGQPGNRIVTLADADYPQALLTTADPPVLLYVKGDLRLLNRPAIAIVGSRNATRQGEANAEAFAQALSQSGLTVVSGLALGIDAAAHRGALAGPGSTIAVIGTGADRIYPAGNEALTREIAERGAIVSEFPLGMPALATNFPRRNRLIAGLTRGCLVVEAAERSGSLITARLANEIGREVFAIPGSIHSPVARGCHKLIRQGAKLVERAEDILEELHWESVVNPAALPPTMEAETDPVLIALGRDPCDLDTLTQRTGLTPEHLLAMLLPLELEGRVAQLPGGRYQRLN
ncbi:MAG: DNA-processing protein DprA [Rhodocyclaceae bacterium]|nr:DNA-processing protein DprA [Rhodocyclaceae bacterium]